MRGLSAGGTDSAARIDFHPEKMPAVARVGQRLSQDARMRGQRNFRRALPPP